MVITKVETQGRFGNGLVGFTPWRDSSNFSEVDVFYQESVKDRYIFGAFEHSIINLFTFGT